VYTGNTNLRHLTKFHCSLFSSGGIFNELPNVFGVVEYEKKSPVGSQKRDFRSKDRKQ
jgi:hypothetical protein